MFVAIASPGDELSYLLFKHPARVQGFALPMGQATVWYPRADSAVTEAALLVDVDATALARSQRFRVDGFELGHYVNDRAYAASSLLAVAIARVFASALRGQDPAERPGAAGAERDLALHLPSVRARGGAAEVNELFGPLGWDVAAVATLPGCVDLRLTGRTTLQRALSQLYVLLPVLDRAKHYWVGEAEVDKLLRHAEGWLSAHPAKDLILARYLAHQTRYVADATARLLAADQAADPPDDREDDEPDAGEDDGEDIDPGPGGRAPNLAQQRADYLRATLAGLGAATVLDLGCGEGRLVADLLRDPATRVTGADVAPRVLARAEARLARLPERQRDRATLIQASATYRDERFAGFDAIVLSEVVEHLDPGRLTALERTVFRHARPRHVLVTTPNADYNELYGLAPGAFRNFDHRFEWTRAEFADWATATARTYGYAVTFAGVGQHDPDHGQPTQVALFSRAADEGGAA